MRNLPNNPAERARPPQLFRFRLRQLMWFVAGISVLLASLSMTDGAWPLVIGVVTILVAGHVFGTMVGTRLRNHARQVQSWRASHGDADLPALGISPNDRTPNLSRAGSSLANSSPAPRWGRWVVLCGAGSAAVVGGALIHRGVPGPLTWAELGIGAAACGVIGGWFTYLAGSFGVTSRVALKEAHAQLQADRERSRRDR